MSVKPYLEQALAAIKKEKEYAINEAKEKINREKIVPYNQDMDCARDEAIAKKQSVLNEEIAVLQNKFAQEKQEIIEAAEKKKTDNANAVIATETYAVTVYYDKVISALEKQITELKE